MLARSFPSGYSPGDSGEVGGSPHTDRDVIPMMETTPYTNECIGITMFSFRQKMLDTTVITRQRQYSLFYHDTDGGKGAFAANALNTK